MKGNVLLKYLDKVGCQIFKLKKFTCKTFSEALTFTEWSDWSRCSRLCDKGHQTRRRTCTGRCDYVNSEDLLDLRACNWNCK